MSNNKDFLSFKEAREEVHKLGITTRREWERKKVWKSCGLAIPGSPYYYYKNKGWRGWEDFLRETPKFKTFEEAKEIVRTLGINSSVEWNTIKYATHRGRGIPATPERYYAKLGWRSWKDFLGYDT